MKALPPMQSFQVKQPSGQRLAPADRLPLSIEKDWRVKGWIGKPRATMAQLQFLDTSMLKEIVESGRVLPELVDPPEWVASLVPNARRITNEALSARTLSGLTRRWKKDHGIDDPVDALIVAVFSKCLERDMVLRLIDYVSLLENRSLKD